MEEQDIEIMIAKALNKDYVTDSLILEALKYGIKIDWLDLKIEPQFYHNGHLRCKRVSFLPCKEKEIKKELKRIKKKR